MTLCGQMVVFAVAGFSILVTGRVSAMDDITGADPVRGRELVRNLGCADCHGMKGQGVEPGWPRLDGQYARYLANQLENFLVGRRPHPFMERYADVLSEEDRLDIARYYACQDSARAGAEECREVQ